MCGLLSMRTIIVQL